MLNIAKHRSIQADISNPDVSTQCNSFEISCETKLAVNNTIVAAIGLPLLNLTLGNGESKEFLVDTGSCFSIVKDYHGEINTCDRPIMTAVNGSSIHVKGTVQATIFINNIAYEHKLVVAQVSHNILGYDFWQAHGLTIVPTSTGVEILPQEMPIGLRALPERRGVFGQVNAIFPLYTNKRKRLLRK